MTFAIGVVGILTIAAIIAAILTIMGKCPAGVAVLFLAVAFIVAYFPKG